MIFNFVYIVEAGLQLFDARTTGMHTVSSIEEGEPGARLTAEPKRPIRSFESRLSQNSDRIKGVPRTRIFRSNAAFGYLRSLIWPLR